jgi:hypothetical protein
MTFIRRARSALKLLDAVCDAQDELAKTVARRCGKGNADDDLLGAQVDMIGLALNKARNTLRQALNFPGPQPEDN